MFAVTDRHSRCLTFPTTAYIKKGTDRMKNKSKKNTNTSVIYSRNNIWNKHDFEMSGLGEKFKFVGKIKHTKDCIKWSKQRIQRGYANSDMWNMHGYLSYLFIEMLQDLRDNRMGSPAYMGEDYVNEDGVLVNDTCHEEWDKILDRMIFLWKEQDEELCTRENPYKEEYDRAWSEFHEKYGRFGEKLQTEGEREWNREHGGRILHTMREVPEYAEIERKYYEEEDKIQQYRIDCKNEAFDLMKEHFYALWD